MTSVLGIHHVTAIAGDAQKNVDFYAGLLGLRLVKKTVNFDDPNSYHLYYGDDAGSPGSLLTFFSWPGAHHGRQGVGQVGVVSLTIAPASIGFWIERLLTHGVKYDGPTRHFGEQVVSFADHDGLLVALVAHPAASTRPAWTGGDVPAEHAVHGLHSASLWEARQSPTAEVLTGTLGFRRVAEHGNVVRYAAGDGGPGTLVDVRAVGGFLDGWGGGGTVHHVAFRTPDDAAQLELRERVEAEGLAPTPVIDRNYFHSVYFRERGGVLFEIATDPPGMTIDEPLDRLGTSLMLPAQYEPFRAAIERELAPLGPPRVGSPLGASAPAG